MTSSAVSPEERPAARVWSCSFVSESAMSCESAALYYKKPFPFRKPLLIQHKSTQGTLITKSENMWKIDQLEKAWGLKADLRAHAKDFKKWMSSVRTNGLGSESHRWRNEKVFRNRLIRCCFDDNKMIIQCQTYRQLLIFQFLQPQLIKNQCWWESVKNHVCIPELQSALMLPWTSLTQSHVQLPTSQTNVKHPEVLLHLELQQFLCMILHFSLYCMTSCQFLSTKRLVFLLTSALMKDCQQTLWGDAVRRFRGVWVWMKSLTLNSRWDLRSEPSNLTSATRDLSATNCYTSYHHFCVFALESV